jgi:hypothetical protein
MDRLLPCVTEVYRNDQYIRVQNVDKSWLIRYTRTDEKWPRRCANAPGPDHGRKEPTVAETSLACEFSARSRDEREACWRRDESRCRFLKYCAGGGDPAGRIAQGTGAPSGQPRGRRASLRPLPARLRAHRRLYDGRGDRRVMGAPAYEERECWRCDRGRVYRPTSPRGGIPAGGWVPYLNCRGTGKAIVCVCAK